MLQRTQDNRSNFTRYELIRDYVFQALTYNNVYRHFQSHSLRSIYCLATSFDLVYRSSSSQLNKNMNLTSMGPCIVNIFQYGISNNKMQLYTVYLYLETVLRVKVLEL